MFYPKWEECVQRKGWVGRQNWGLFGDSGGWEAWSRMTGVASGERGGLALYLRICRLEAVSVAYSFEGTGGLSGGCAWIIGVNPISDDLDVLSSGSPWSHWLSGPPWAPRSGGE